MIGNYYCVFKMASKKLSSYMCSITNEMKSTYNFVAPSKVSTNHFFCTVCGKDISLSHGGENYIEKHSKTTCFSACEAGLKYSARRTKTACIIKCIGDSMFKELKVCAETALQFTFGRK